MGGIGRRLRICHEAKVVVAVRLLRPATGAYKVDLGGHLVARAEPCLAHRIDRGGGEVAGEYLRVRLAELLQRVPDPIIGSCLGKMVAAAASARLLRRDDPLVDRRRGVYGAAIDGTPQHQHTRQIAQHLHPFRHQRAAADIAAQHRAERSNVIDRHVLLDTGGKAKVARIKVLGAERREIVDPAIFGAVIAHLSSSSGVQTTKNCQAA